MGHFDCGLYKKKHAVPREDHIKRQNMKAAYVKRASTGQHKWIVSFDINSLYFYILIQYNISLEKIIGVKSDGVSVNKMLKGTTPRFLKTEGACITPNGALFKTDNQGFLPEMMEKMYNERVIFKKRMLKAKQQYQRTKNQNL